MSKNNYKRHVFLSLGEEGKRHYVLVKDLSTFMCDHILHRGKRHFCLQTYSTEKRLKIHINDCFKISGKQTIQIPKKAECVRFKNYDRKIKSPFMIYAGFEIILVPGDNEKQNPEESYILYEQISKSCCLHFWLYISMC